MRCLTRLLCVSALLVSVAFAESLSETRKNAEKGDALAQFNLGWMYANGTGVPKDSAEAVKWYRKAAEQGYVGAQNNLGPVFGGSSEWPAE
ncbi:MAG: sel1 repeat family protein [Opitutus sp.]|nr:sel1 repeat family protein [Opitutus sp.]